MNPLITGFGRVVDFNPDPSVKPRRIALRFGSLAPGREAIMVREKGWHEKHDDKRRERKPERDRYRHRCHQLSLGTDRSNMSGARPPTVVAAVSTTGRSRPTTASSIAFRPGIPFSFSS